MSETRLESFPFDSQVTGTDELGHPVLDRAVGADMLRETLRKFFGDGVFPNPASNMQPSKGTGLRIRLEEGAAIIDGAICRVPDGGQEFELEPSGPTVGTYCHGVFVRLDDNLDKRSCYIYTRKNGSGIETPPEPETELAGIKEYRIAYVLIPTNSTNLSAATLVDERGTESCPFAAPLFDVDVSFLVDKVKADIDSEYQKYSGYVDQYIELLMTAVDGTTAGELQNRMTAVELKMDETEQTVNEKLDEVNERLGAYYAVLEDATGVI